MQTDPASDLICGFKGCTLTLSQKASIDPDEAYCLIHGTRYLNEPLDIPMTEPKTPTSIGRFCQRCDKAISSKATHCKACMALEYRDHPEKVAHPPMQPMRLTPRRKPEAVL